jgi:hypothetical protein
MLSLEGMAPAAKGMPKGGDAGIYEFFDGHVLLCQCVAPHPKPNAA